MLSGKRHTKLYIIAYNMLKIMLKGGVRIRIEGLLYIGFCIFIKLLKYVSRVCEHDGDRVVERLELWASCVIRQTCSSGVLVPHSISRALCIGENY